MAILTTLSNDCKPFFHKINTFLNPSHNLSLKIKKCIKNNPEAKHTFWISIIYKLGNNNNRKPFLIRQLHDALLSSNQRNNPIIAHGIDF
jgi:hypothetical protein